MAIPLCKNGVGPQYSAEHNIGSVVVNGYLEAELYVQESPLLQLCEPNKECLDKLFDENGRTMKFPLQEPLKM